MEREWRRSEEKSSSGAVSNGCGRKVMIIRAIDIRYCEKRTENETMNAAHYFNFRGLMDR